MSVSCLILYIIKVSHYYDVVQPEPFVSNGLVEMIPCLVTIARCVHIDQMYKFKATVVRVRLNVATA